MQNLGYWVNAQPVNPQRFNPANYDQPEDQLVQTDPLYAMIYLAQVRTVCADTLWSDWSEPILFSAACALAPTDSLYANEVTDSSALITSQVMPQAQLYVFSYRPAGTQEWTLSTELTSPSLPLIGLQSDTEYEVKMRYRCQADVWSNFGEVMTFRTLPYCGGPENIAFSDITATSLTVSWATGPNAATTNFRYRLAGTDGPWQTASFAGSPAVLGDLAPGSAYELEAVSECAVNSSYVTDRYTFNLSCAPPSLLVSDVTIDAARLNIFDLSPAALRNSFSYRVVGVTDWILVDSAT